ncbi:hypothetical protein [Comamonas sp. C24C]
MKDGAIQARSGGLDICKGQHGEAILQAAHHPAPVPGLPTSSLGLDRSPIDSFNPFIEKGFLAKTPEFQCRAAIDEQLRISLS